MRGRGMMDGSGHRDSAAAASEAANRSRREQDADFDEEAPAGSGARRGVAVVDAGAPAHGFAGVMRGGFHLCRESYCRRHRVSARSANTPDGSTGNLGFCCAADA